MQSDSAWKLQPKKLFKKAKLYGNSLWFWFWFFCLGGCLWGFCLSVYLFVFILPFPSLNINFCSRIIDLKDQVTKKGRNAFLSLPALARSREGRLGHQKSVSD